MKIVEEIPTPYTETTNIDSETIVKKRVLKRSKKLQLKVSKRGVMFRGLSTPDSPASKKQNALEVAQNLKKFKPSTDDTQMEKITVEKYCDSEETDDATEPKKDTSVKSTFKETSIPDVTTKISNMDAHINSSEQQSTSLLENSKVIPLEVSHSGSNMEEDETLNIKLNLSDKDTNVTMDEGMISIANSTIGTTTIKTSVVPPPTSPPTTSMILLTSTSAISLTFEGVM